MCNRKYNSLITISILIILLFIAAIILQSAFTVPVTYPIQMGNQTTTFVQIVNMGEKIVPLLFLIMGILITLSINEYKSIKKEEKLFSVIKTEISRNQEILNFNKTRIEYELRVKGIEYIPFKSFTTDFWNLINYNPPKRIMNDDLYLKIGNVVLIMDSFNENSKLKEFHKAFETDKFSKIIIFNKNLIAEIQDLDKLLNEISDYFQ